MFDFYTGSLPKAKKPHHCEFCGKTIASGEIYSRESGVYSGDFFDRILCVNCIKMLDAYCTNIDNEFDWDDVYDYVRDTHCSACGYFDECELSIHDCQKIKDYYSHKKEVENEKRN